MPVTSTSPCSIHPSDSRSPWLLLCSDAPDWHARQLTAAAGGRNFNVVWASYDQCAIACRNQNGRIALPTTDGEPLAVIARCIAAGSLEQITMRLSILHGLRESGCRVFNDARVIEHMVDKAMCGFLLARAGLPVPETLSCESSKQACRFVEDATSRGQKIVLKPLFGAQGQGLQLITQSADLPVPETIGGVYHLQHYVGPQDPSDPGCDFRVMVIGGQAVAAMRRTGIHWITNVRQGARCQPVAATGRLGELAVAAAKALNADYAGVDVICDPQGQWYILEVNSIPAWKGLQTTTSITIADHIIDHIIDHVTAQIADGPCSMIAHNPI